MTAPRERLARQTTAQPLTRSPRSSGFLPKLKLQLSRELRSTPQKIAHVVTTYCL
jgi:hypothetical protein